jgi:2-keto-4-pentenoate hydratase/2-oxohepta-3-ene-1,7-dioic acid hydratase in catechol pathway
MRWIQFIQAGEPCYGVLEGDLVAAVTGSPFGEYSISDRSLRFDEVELALPFAPRTFYAVGQNYIVHASNYPGGQQASNAKVPTKPDVAYRSHSGLIAHEGQVVIPQDSTSLHYEGELVAVIGKRGKRIRREDAWIHILGYTIGNDVSERSWQRIDRTPWRAKNSDTFSPMGPWIETCFDVKKAETIVRVNGQETTRFRTGDMLFGVDQFISAVSDYVTLQPGDMFWMGTEGLSPDLKDQDVVEVEITGIGTLRNRFVSESAS